MKDVSCRGRSAPLTSSHCVLVRAIPGCQLDYIWNELQSRIGGLTCDPDLEAGRHKFLTWILARKFLSSRSAWGKASPRSRLGGTHTPLIWATPYVGPHLMQGHTLCWSLYKDTGRRKNHFFFCLNLLARRSVGTSTEDQPRRLALWD